MFSGVVLRLFALSFKFSLRFALNFSNRVEGLIEKFSALGVDGFLLMPTHGIGINANIFYLTGFEGSSAYLLVTPSARVFITDSRYLEKVSGTLSDWEIADISGKKLPDLFAFLNGKLGISKLGFEAGQVPYATAEKLREDFAPVSLVATNGVVEDMRVIKEDEEVSLIKEAIRINEDCFDYLMTLLSDDVTERDLAAEFEYALRKRGALLSSFPPIIAAGANASKPHAGFTDQKLLPGAPLTIDIGVFYRGYCSDMTRTVFYKDCPEIWRKRYEAVLAAKNAAQDYVRAGQTGEEVDAVARRTIIEAGFERDVYTHGLGHGIGIEIHESPRFAVGFTGDIPSGAVLSCEPGIYVPGEGGIRIEDLVLVKENGAVNLNNLNTALKVVG